MLTANRAFVLVLAGLLIASTAAVVQAVRIVRPTEILPGLAAIEGATGQLSTANGVGSALKQTRANVEAAAAELARMKASPPMLATALQSLKAADASLGIAESELVQQAAKTTTIAAEVAGHVRILREQVGPPATLDRLAGLTIKELLIAFAWPLMAAAVVLYALGTEQGRLQLSGFIKQFRSVKLPGLEFVVGDELKQTAEEAFRFHREQIKKQFDIGAQRQGVRETVTRLLENDIDPFFRAHLEDVPEYRCTVHVPDLLFADSLYQLIDYVPSGAGARGRAWSVRYGMMGKQWRLGKSARDEVTSNVDDLIRDWGMTRSEAQGAGKRSNSLVCVILRSQTGEPVGIFYMDAAKPCAFGPEDQTENLLAEIENACLKHGLTDALSRLQDDLRRQAPLIQIYG